MLNEIVKFAQNNGFNSLVGEYIPTVKNVIIKDLLNNLGFKKKNKFYHLDVTSYQSKNCFIKK